MTHFPHLRSSTWLLLAALPLGACAWWQKNGAAVIETGLCILVDAAELKSFGEIKADCQTDLPTIAATLDHAEAAVARMQAAPDSVIVPAPGVAAAPPPAPAVDAASSCVLDRALTAPTVIAVANACNTSRASVDATLAEARRALQRSARERSEYKAAHQGP